MKHLSIIAMMMILLSSSVLWAQEKSRIYLRNGDIIKGEIIEAVPEVSIKVELDDGSIISYQMSEVLKTEVIPISRQGSIGLGFGIPYGILGGNLDINVAPNLNLSAGIGTTALAGIGYNLGLKYFFTPIERTFRPRVSAYYGTNAVSELTKTTIVIGGTSSSSTETKSYSGLNLGIGAQWMWGETKSHGLDFDILYVATTGLDIEKLRNEGFTIIEEPGKVRISIGYRYAF